MRGDWPRIQACLRFISYSPEMRAGILYAKSYNITIIQ